MCISEILNRFSEGKFHNTLQGYLKDVLSVLELHKASHIVTQSNDPILEELNSWTGQFLKDYVSTFSRNIQKPYDHLNQELKWNSVVVHTYAIS